MKALSIKQPWASLIASGRKTIELRTWQTHYRGPLIVCSSGSPRRGTPFEIGPRGVALCVVELESIERASPLHERAACSGVNPGEFAWHLSNPRPFEPLPYKGQLNIFTPSDALITYVRKHLGK
jgi:hypothetical protein